MPSPYGRQRPETTVALVGDRRDELAREPRLADARRPEHRDKPADTLGDRTVKSRSHCRKLVPAPDKGSVVAPFEGGSPLDHADEAVRGNRVGLPLEQQRLDRLDLDGSARQRTRPFSEQDLAGRSGLLEPRGDVDRVARRKALFRPGDHLAGVDARSQLQRDAVIPTPAPR